MQRKEILIRGWDFACDVEGWYPPLKASLKDVDFTQAQWKPEGASSHSIAALVNHLLYYKKRFLFRLENREWTITIESNDETFQITNYGNAEAWDNAVTELQSVNRSIRKKLVSLEDRHLDSSLPKDPIDDQILNLMMHDAYHTGQIVQIRKLYGSWPSVRKV